MLPRAKDVLGPVVLSILHCKEKARPQTQVMQKAHDTGRKSIPEAFGEKKPQTSKTAKGSESKLQLGTTWKQRDKGGSDLKIVIGDLNIIFSYMLLGKLSGEKYFKCSRINF